MAQNLIEKIAQRFAVGLEKGEEVHSGDIIMIKPAYVMTHDNTGAVIPKFLSTGAMKIADPRQVVFALDHNVQDKSEKNLKKYSRIEAFARELGVDFYPAGRGIGHQIMCEEGYAFPGTLVVASDSHSNMYGGLGCLGTPVVRTDAAAIWATGKTWWQIPPVVRVILSGKLAPHVSGKDLILSLCGLMNKDEVLNHAIEFSGSAVSTLGIDERLTIANMTTEWGALAGVFSIDEITLAWLKGRARYLEKRGPAGVPSHNSSEEAHPRLNMERITELEKNLPVPDEGAFYARKIEIDISDIQPVVAGPHNVKTVHPVSYFRKNEVPIDKAYLVSCVNSRAGDLRAAAEILRGKKISPKVKFYVAAASAEVQKEVEESGHWDILLEAGAIPLPPGCGPCIGLGTGLLEDGETGISATNRNFKGRMGSRDARAYLASPAVVAASALAGKIDLPGEWKDSHPKYTFHTFPLQKTEGKTVVLKGFPEHIKGELLFCPADNLNTDGIYPGKYTYIDDFGPEDQAGVVMENYDPDFHKTAREGDILVGGFNFGTGSSREQAATALKYRGIQLVIAGSFSETYKRNAINNGFLTIEIPDLVKKLREKFGDEKLTVRTGVEALLDFSNGVLSCDLGKFSFKTPGSAAQEIIITGGLEAWVKNQVAG